MKKYIYILVLVATSLSISSCVNVNNKANRSRYNEQQTAFDNFLSHNRDLSNSQKNKIQEKEFMKDYEKRLFHYVDSVKLFVNWQGQISDINTNPTGKNSTSVEFTITYQPEQYRKIEFNCLYVVNTDSLDNDHIYNTVKNISNYSTVYFDGIIRTTNNETVKYSSFNSPGDDLNIPYPDYDFFIVEVGTANRGDSLSLNLQKAIDCSYKIIEPLRLNYLKQITKKEKEARWKALEPEFNEAKAKLTSDEDDYLKRVNQALTFNFLYGD